ncbi:hypothetical protein [Campylobacter hyointestinalis]|nr:hypothetical protein [Campylobacter hyointestinalis]
MPLSADTFSLVLEPPKVIASFTFKIVSFALVLSSRYKFINSKFAISFAVIFLVFMFRVLLVKTSPVPKTLYPP